MRPPSLDGGPEKIVLAGSELFGLIAELKHRYGYRLKDSHAIQIAQRLLIEDSERKSRVQPKQLLTSCEISYIFVINKLEITPNEQEKSHGIESLCN
jgi:hypothetical protein